MNKKMFEVIYLCKSSYFTNENLPVVLNKIKLLLQKVPLFYLFFIYKWQWKKIGKNLLKLFNYLFSAWPCGCFANENLPTLFQKNKTAVTGNTVYFLSFIHTLTLFSDICYKKSDLFFSSIRELDSSGFIPTMIYWKEYLKACFVILDRMVTFRKWWILTTLLIWEVLKTLFVKEIFTDMYCYYKHTNMRTLSRVACFKLRDWLCRDV